MQLIVIRTETNITTEIYEMSIDRDSCGFPTVSDRAISSTTKLAPVASENVRSVDFKVMERS